MAFASNEVVNLRKASLRRNSSKKKDAQKTITQLTLSWRKEREI